METAADVEQRRANDKQRPSDGESDQEIKCLYWPHKDINILLLGVTGAGNQPLLMVYPTTGLTQH